MEKYVNYNALLDTLFEQWKNSYDEDNRNKFCKDGLMLIPDNPNPNNLSYVDELWEKSERRVMFLLKDSPDGGQDDIRRWLVEHEECRNLTGGRVGRTGFLPNIAMMLYGLMVTKKDYRLGYSEVSNTKMDEVKKMWNSISFALVEAKKQAGKPWVSKEEIENAIRQDNLFLAKEIDILKPNIIVCCDAENTQFDFITQTYFNGRDAIIIQYDHPTNKRIKCCLYYYDKDNVVVIQSFHPTRLGKDDWMIYERAISPFGTLMNNYNPNF
jgi:hypothetical protein